MPRLLRTDKWLFICSANVARSPTAEYLARRQGMLARSCGTGGRRGEHAPYTVTPMTQEILAWADVIVAMKLGHRIAAEKFPVARKKKFFVWDQPDDWGVPYHPEMVEIMERKLLETQQLYDKWLEEKGRASHDDATTVG